MATILVWGAMLSKTLILFLAGGAFVLSFVLNRLDGRFKRHKPANKHFIRARPVSGIWLRLYRMKLPLKSTWFFLYTVLLVMSLVQVTPAFAKQEAAAQPTLVANPGKEAIPDLEGGEITATFFKPDPVYHPFGNQQLQWGESAWAILLLGSLLFAANIFSLLNNVRRKKIEESPRGSTERLRNLHEIEKAIIAAQSLNETAEVALRQLKQFIPWTGAGVSLIDREFIEVVAVIADDDLSSVVLTGTRFATNQERAASIFKTLSRGESYLVKDILSLADLISPIAEHLARSKMRSILIVPLIFQGELIGLLSLAAPESRFFNTERIEICEEVANQLAIAIKQAKLLEAEQAQREMAEALRDSIGILTSTLDLSEVLERILDNLERVVPHDAANIMLVEEGIARIVGRRGYVERGLDEAVLAIRYPVDETPNLRQMIDTDGSLIIPDAWEYPGWVDSLPNLWIRGYIGVPIQLGDQVIGFLNVDSATPDFYSQEHAEHLQVFANQAAIAIRNAQLYEAEHKRRKIAETLQEAATVLNATLELDGVLDLILRQLRMVIDYDSAAIQRIEKDHMVILACGGFERPEKVVGLRFPLSPKFPNTRVVELKKPLALADAAQEYPHFQEDASLFESGHIRSWLGVPLLVKDRLIGMITLDRTEVRPYTQEDIDLVTAFASQAAVAVENASLHQIALERATRLELVGRIGRQASSILTLDDLLPQAVKSINDTFGYFYTNILLAEGNELVLSAATLPELQVLFQRVRLKIGEEGITGWVAHHGEPLLVDDVRQDSRYVLHTDAERLTRSELAVPIKLWDQVIGVLNVESEEVGAFTQADLSTLQTIADQLAVAIHNARLYEQITSHAEDLEQRVAERTAELKAANEHLKTLSHLKDEFVSNVSHELRTPITSLKLRIYLLEKQIDEPEHLEVMRRETDRLQRIVEGLLELSRLDQRQNTLDLQIVDLNNMVGVYVNDRLPIAQERGLKLVFVPDEDLPPVEADPSLFGQVLGVLLTNALNYTPSGGQIKVQTHTVQFDWQTRVGFSVSDTGPGIPPDEMPRLFERFFRGTIGELSRVPGTGLGLAIAKEIVEQHHGRIEVESEGIPGKGSTFTVWLPVCHNQ